MNDNELINDPPTAATDESQRIAQLQAQLDERQDQYLRCRADMDNLRKRAEREREDARLYALKDALESLLPVLDSFDQAMASRQVGGDDQGFTLIHKQLLDALHGHGVEVIDPLGEQMDPDVHEVLTVQPASGQPPNTVVAVMQKGYRLNGRLIRPARVMCAVDA